MRKFLLLAMLILIMPLLSMGISGSGPSSPGAYTAIAGHMASGQWCECGSPGCVCDPGEILPSQHGLTVRGLDPVEGTAPITPEPDYAEVALIGAALILVVLRFRLFA